jgi:hypothetical protein
MSHEAIEFDPVSHIYKVNGRAYPSVTTILKSVGLTADFSMVKPDVLEYKRRLGEEVHRVIELDLQDDLAEYDPVLEPYISAWRKFRDDLKIELIETETPIFSAKYGYAGKLDLLARFNGNEEGLFDFKTSVSVDIKSVGPQLKAYDNGYREWRGLIDKKPYKCFAVQLMDDGKYKLYSCTNSNDLNVFLYALQINNWKNSKAS